MSDDAIRAAVHAAYRRLAGTVLTSTASISERSRLREAIRKTLTDMGEQIDSNPIWLDEVIRDVTGGPSDAGEN